MEVVDILNKWAEFIDFNPERTRFKLGTYWIHDGNKKVQKLFKYDDTGVLSLLYAKDLCKKVLKESSPASFFDIIEDDSYYLESKGMWNDFNSPFILSLENEFKDKINSIVDSVTDSRLIGDYKSEVEIEQLLSFMTTAIDGIEALEYDVYAKGAHSGGGIGFNTFIHVFETTEECVRAINTAKNAIYICYIRMDDSAYGYFGFFVKDGDNIFSLSERIDEKYPGQNQNKRNHRDAESKQYDLFPYGFIFEFEGHDYKGYASKHVIDDTKLAIFNLGPSGYLPLVIAMFIINKIYVGKAHSKPLSYIHAIAIKTESVAISGAGNNSLVPIENNTSLAKTYQNQVIINYEKDKFLRGEYSAEFNNASESDSYKDYGIFTNEKQHLVDLYEEGFDENHLSISTADRALHIGNSEGHNKFLLESIMGHETIGSKKRTRMIHYWWIRSALAKHISNEMNKELESFGGKQEVINWYKTEINKNIEHIQTILVGIYGSKDPKYEGVSKLFRKEETTHPHGYNTIVPNERTVNQYDTKFLCPINGMISNIFFTFKPETWKDLSLVLDEDTDSLPKIVKGWQKRHNFSGNSILDIIDPVSMLQHPLSRDFGMNNFNNNHIDFSFSIGFSKRGFISMCNKHGIKISINSI